VLVNVAVDRSDLNVAGDRAAFLGGVGGDVDGELEP